MSVEDDFFKELTGLDLKVVNDYVRVGEYKDKEGCGDLYFNIKTLTFYKEKDFRYLVFVEDYKQHILLKYLVNQKYKRGD